MRDASRACNRAQRADAARQQLTWTRVSHETARALLDHAATQLQQARTLAPLALALLS